MTTFVGRKALNRFDRWAMRLADLMSRAPTLVRGDATIRETIDFLADKGTTAAPVIDEAGRPMGVLSLSDFVTAIGNHGIEDQALGKMQVSECVPPFVILLNLDTPVFAVVGELSGREFQQIYVADEQGVLVGVLSSSELPWEFRRQAEEQCAEGCSTAA